MDIFWRAFSFLLAVLLLCSGTYLVYVQLFQSDETRWLLVLSTGFLMLMGGAWIYAEFLLPLLGKTGEKDREE